jgi:type 1 glutamine amidotransferase
MNPVLIIWGGWPGHDPAACAEFFATELSSRGFTVELSDALTVLDDAAKLAEFALIVPMWTMGTLTDQQEKKLVAVIAGGTGLAGFHGGMGDAFRGRIDYQWMVGGQFVSHPDDLQYYQVNIVNRPDPITDGIEDFTVRTEQYYMLVDPRNEVLATTVMRSRSAPWVDGVVVPVMWKKIHGVGRVFYSALGHQCAEFKASPPQLELTLRGMQWATR